MKKIIIYLIGFWPSNRKDKKEKKDEKKRSNNSKASKTTQIQQQQHDETGSVHSQNSAFETNDFNKVMGSMDGLNQIPSNITKSKCVIILI
jgi:FtsZ-interacting cell division protein ZipA